MDLSVKKNGIEGQVNDQCSQVNKVNECSCPSFASSDDDRVSY